ncbi:ribulokinase [Ureibacillus sinduriensis]|nr:ribulokinase [Ureibacillus sinduriensis]
MYAIGFDFGTETGRALLIHIETAEIIATIEVAYPHGVIAKQLNDRPLKNAMVLQNPNDYEWTLKELTERIVKETNISKEQIKGIGIDFTSSTVLPITADFEPLMKTPEFSKNPHAYAKLWKSHSADKEARIITERLAAHPYLEKYGNIISSEWLLPKLLEVIHDEPTLFNKMDYFIEAGDWLVAKLTGRLVRSNCMAGYKGLWQKSGNYLDRATLASIHPALEEVYDTKLVGDVLPVGTFAGYLREDMANWLGLSCGTAVGVGMIDAHAAVIGAGLSEPNELLIVVGTSSCHLLLSEKETVIPGISGVVEDGIIPGLFAYEAGQVAVGDIFSYFVKKQLPEKYYIEANLAGKSVFEVLNDYASKLEVGESGLVALDWHNGNRTPFVNPNLSSVMVGETLLTESYEVYRALVESTAFGTKVILDLFERNQVPVNRVVLTGGIPRKNHFLVQVYADVLQKEITVINQDHVSALGAAIIGVAAAKREPVNDLIKQYAAKQIVQFKPNAQYQKKYQQLYEIYQKLSTLFGKNETILKELKELKSKEEVLNSK